MGEQSKLKRILKKWTKYFELMLWDSLFQNVIFRCKQFDLLCLTPSPTPVLSLRLFSFKFHRCPFLCSVPSRASILYRSKAFNILMPTGSELHLFLAQPFLAILQDVSFTSATQPGSFPKVSLNTSAKGCPVSFDTLLRSGTHQPSRQQL